MCDAGELITGRAIMNGYWRYAFVCALTATALLFAMGYAVAAPANPQVLYAFCYTAHHCTDEQHAFGFGAQDVVAGPDGAYYGTTVDSGATDEHGFFIGGGSVYRADPTTRTIRVLYQFQSYYSPTWLKAGRDGYLYGGYTREDPVEGTKIAGFFRLSVDGEFTTLHEGGAAKYACGALVQDSLGNWVGTTNSEGAASIFKLTPDGSYEVVYTFPTDQILSCPHYEPVLAADGNLYGVISQSHITQGTNGAIYRLTPDDTVTILHQFDAVADGWPTTPISIGPDGALYGLATHIWESGPLNMMYRISLDGQFTNLGGFGPSGLETFEKLTLMPDGDFYGSGIDVENGQQLDNVIFRLSPAGEYTSLRRVKHNTDPSTFVYISLLTRGFDNALYGTTFEGGKYGGGELFRYMPPPVQ